MAAPPTPSSTDVEMPDAPTSPASSGLSSPPDSGSDNDNDDEWVDLDSTDQQLNSPDQATLSSPSGANDMSNMATRRSARNANKPRTALVDSPPRPPKRKIVSKMSAKKAPKWTAEKLLTDSKSPLASADLRTILCQPAAWDILSKDERAGILALFPAGTRILDEGTDDARPDFEALLNDNNFRHDCVTYSKNIEQGRHDPEWLEQAWAARERRRMGDFDAYLAQKFEDEWSCELPEGFRPNRNGEPAAAAATDKEEEEQDSKGSVDVDGADGSAAGTTVSVPAPAVASDTKAASSRAAESDVSAEPVSSGPRDIIPEAPAIDVKGNRAGGAKADGGNPDLANDGRDRAP
ncbi:proline-rich early nodulin [Colletotrichum sojae]|uniref:Proline-rich early nodulin n=1 Tax=Colletotrichum sojae TaxID=2175907 RepID=A0A8H6J8E6_9PEZI|nr:proline-rich early nodulin [Colletotrichum sojae]